MPDRSRIFDRDSYMEPKFLDKDIMKLSEVFADLPPPALLDRHSQQNHAGEIDSFMEFLSALSIDDDQDIKKLGLDKQKYREYIYNDIIAFRNLDSQVFQMEDLVAIPPSRYAEYSFTPWNNDDTLQTILAAVSKETLEHEGWFYAEALNELCRSIFEADINIIDTCMTRAGIYTFKVTDITEYNDNIQREQIPAGHLLHYLSWNLINAAKYVVYGQ
jgi:hypothetical protein